MSTTSTVTAVTITRQHDDFSNPAALPVTAIPYETAALDEVTVTRTINTHPSQNADLTSTSLISSNCGVIPAEQ